MGGGALFINSGDVTLNNTSFDKNSVTSGSLGEAINNAGV